MNIKGYCPTQLKDTSIEVSYVRVRSSADQEMLKGQFSCDHLRIGRDCPITNNCPLYENAPQKIK